MSFIMLLIGFLLLIKGADYFVEGASTIARKFHIPSMVIGLTIVSIGTSLPELSVSLTSALIGKNDLAVANVVGSNIFNILMGLGVSGIISKLPIEKNTIETDIPFLNIIGTILLVMMLNLTLGRFEGILLIGLLIGFLFYIIKPILNNKEELKEENKLSFKTILLGILGVVGIILGGDIVVDSASNIAKMFGMSQNLIGLTVVATGTSLPEFVTSVMAIIKGENEIAVGNIVGSNIFNILMILGISSIISPITITFISIIDIMFMIATGILLYVFVVKSKTLNRYQGIVFILLYIGYISYTIFR